MKILTMTSLNKN